MSVIFELSVIASNLRAVNGFPMEARGNCISPYATPPVLIGGCVGRG